MMTKQFNWQQFATAEDIANCVYQQIEVISSEAIKTRGSFKIVLAGGTTPGNIYKKLVNLKTDWDKWHIFFGDERCLEVDNPQRNSKMAFDNWLSHVNISKNNIHIIKAELGSKQAAKLYQHILQPILPFDLVLNGMGEDGHTASLFPDNFSLNNFSMKSKELNQQPLTEAIDNSPKPPSDRVSLSLKALASTYYSFIIITGKSKYNAIQHWQNGKQLPINQLSCLADSLTGQTTPVDIFIDQPALTGN